MHPASRAPRTRPSAARLPLARTAGAFALALSSAIGLAGGLAGALRLFPWLIVSEVPWRVAEPFARGVGALVLESALACGWPIGWALACVRAVESGAARVLQTLGESPSASMRRLAPQGAAFAAALAIVGAVSGSDANAPGRVVTELVVRARESCANASAPATYVVPFTGMTWLCGPDREPRIAGSVRGVRGDVVATARDARISGDFRSVDLVDARVLLPGAPSVAVHAQSVTMHGMPPWAHASTLPPALRALLLALSAWSTASVAAWGVLAGAVHGRAGATILGAAGPLIALSLLRSLERADARPAAFFLVPVAACAGAVTMTWLFARMPPMARTVPRSWLRRG